MDDFQPDYRKSLSTLETEWSSCTKCELGVRRAEVGGSFVFGEGSPRGIMFIGEGPGKDEEQLGRPFIGRSGQVLRSLIKKVGITRHYISNVVACRACGQTYDTEGNPRFWKDRKTGAQVPVIKDQAPTPAQMQACLPRLYQEIYSVDPVLIVALGGPAADTLTRGSVGILAESGATRAITIPGAGFVPNLTEKRKVWARKVQGELIKPVDQNKVEYLLLPLVHPAYVLRKRKDERHGSPVEIFLEGLKKAADIYDRYMFEVYGDHPGSRELTEDDFIEALQDDG